MNLKIDPAAQMQIEKLTDEKRVLNGENREVIPAIVPGKNDYCVFGEPDDFSWNTNAFTGQMIIVRVRDAQGSVRSTAARSSPARHRRDTPKKHL